MKYLFEAAFELSESAPTAHPAEAQDTQSQDPEPRQAEPPVLWDMQPRILHIEDDDDDAFLVHEWMREAAAGAQMSRAQRLQDAVYRLKDEQFEAVIFDLELPDSVGIAGIAQLRQAAPSVPIVVLSGHDDPSLASAVVQEGADRFLSKLSTSPEQLAHAVLETIRAAGIGIPLGSSLTEPHPQSHPGSEESPESLTKALLDRAARKDSWRRTWC